MKLIFLIYDTGVDEQIDDLITKLDISGYTKIFDAQGLGGAGKKIGNAVFPGLNNVLLINLSEEKLKILSEEIKKLKSTFRINPGISIFAVESVEMV